MSDQAVFRATVHGLRTVPSRKVLQIVIETPIEQLPHVASVCEYGAWLVVARICSEQGEIEKPDRSWNEMSAVEQSGILCKEPSFWKFLEERYDVAIEDIPAAADQVRELCGVKSRREIIPGTIPEKRWEHLMNDYRVWQLVPKIVG